VQAGSFFALTGNLRDAAGKNLALAETFSALAEDNLLFAENLRDAAEGFLVFAETFFALAETSRDKLTI
jgi:hypothetical protein